MAWPPPTFRVDYANATPQQDEHPAAHNGVNDSLNQDFVPKINAVQTDADAAQADIDAHTANVTSGDGTTETNLLFRFQQVANEITTHIVDFPAVGRIAHGQTFVRTTSQTPIRSLPYSGFTTRGLLEWRLMDLDQNAWPSGFNPSNRIVAGQALFWNPTSNNAMYGGSLIKLSNSSARITYGPIYTSTTGLLGWLGQADDQQSPLLLGWEIGQATLWWPNT